MRSALLIVAAGLIAAGCGAPQARFPSDVQTSFADRDMRRLETDLLVVYYPDGRHELARRMATRVEGCAAELNQRTRIHNRHSREKLVIVVPEAPFNNAYVLPPTAGLADVSVIPAANTLDFTTLFGLPPDPGHIGCHEIVHYVHVRQMAGLWSVLRTVLGDLVTPQVGLDPWFFEGLATYYEARLQTAGRPRWPVFTGMFHAAYAGGELGAGELSEHKRMAPVGHQYLVGAMFIEFLAERYGEAALWRVIELQGASKSILLSVNGRFQDVYGKGLGELVGEFRGWIAQRFPVRTRPASERVVQALGTDARWAWSPTGDVAAIDSDSDAPVRLTVWDQSGRVIERRSLIDLLPPRGLVIAAPILVSGMSFARDGTLWFTTIDLAGTYQTTRLLRWRRLDGLQEISHGHGPGGTILPDGQTYVHMVVDGDRWSLTARDLATGTSRVLWDAAPGQYALRVGASPDGTRLAVSAWDGTRFVVRVLDAARGTRVAELAGTSGGPVYDATYTDDGRLVFLEEIDRRFQAVVVEPGGTRQVLTDAPYGILEPRVVGGRLRFLARTGWRWTIDEVALPAPAPITPTPTPDLDPSSVSAPTDPGRTPPSPSLAPSPSPSPSPSLAPSPPPSPAAAPSLAPPGSPDPTTSLANHPLRILSDRPYSRFDHLFRPSLHTLALLSPAVGVTQVGLALSGSDRLDLVRWAAAGYVDTRDRKASVTGGLLLNDLAPWVVSVTGTRLAFTERDLDDDGEVTATYDREVRDVVGAIGRTWRGTYSLAVGGTFSADRIDDRTLRLFGPEAHLAYAAIEATPYTGIRRGLVLTGDGAYFPRGGGAITDGRGELDVFLPLPLLDRHILNASARAHAITGPGAEAPLLEVGGFPSATPLWQSREDTVAVAPGDDVLPGQRRFTEYLRGFEDLPLSAERAALADLSWRYPLVIDRGIPNLWFFPASFLSQLELELFGAGAVLRPEDARYHLAAGGAVTLRLTLFRVPLALQYQGSRRFSDDRAWLQLVSLGSAP